MVYVFFLLGIFGFLGLSVLFPLLALPGYRFQRRILRKQQPDTYSNSVLSPSIEVIMPAHNEGEHIGATLRSIQRSLEHLLHGASTQASPKITVHVGADGCTDQTASVARQFPMVKV